MPIRRLIRCYFSASAERMRLPMASLLELGWSGFFEQQLSADDKTAFRFARWSAK
jgi:hypothetical protein